MYNTIGLWINSTKPHTDLTLLLPYKEDCPPAGHGLPHLLSVVHNKGNPAVENIFLCYPTMKTVTKSFK